MSAAALPRGEVHVWWCAPSGVPGIEAWTDYLDREERDRAAAFRFEADRRSWAEGRAALRALAGRYLDAAPQKLRFERGPAGKPRISGAPLHFSLSRSGGAVLLAFAADREIGADLERLRPDDDGMEVAGRFFAPGEVASLAALPEGIRSEAFFRCWTAKEAYLKARGEGLGFPLDAFEVPAPASGPQRLVAHRDADEVGRWWLVPFTPADGWVATVAAPGQPPILRRFEAGRS